MSSEIRNYMRTHTPQPKNVSKMILGQTDLLVYDILEASEDNGKPIEILCTPNLESLYSKTNGVPVCSWCGNTAKNIQDYKERYVDDLPIRSRRVVLHILYNTYKCTSCNRTFSPVFSGIDPKGKISKRLKTRIIKDAFEKETFLLMAENYHVSDTLIHNLFVEEAEKRLEDFHCISKKHLLIDEMYIHCKGTKKGTLCVSILGSDTDDDSPSVVAFEYPPRRDLAHIVEMLSNLDQPEIVETISMDMNAAFREAVRTVIPFCRIIVDRYHLVQSLNDKVRKVATNIYNEEKAKYHHVLEDQVDDETLKLGNEIDEQDDIIDELTELFESSGRKQYLEKLEQIQPLSPEQEEAKRELKFLAENYHNRWFATNPENLSKSSRVKFRRLFQKYPEFSQLYEWKERLRVEFFEAETAEIARSLADNIEQEIPRDKNYRPMMTYFKTLNHSDWTDYIYDYFSAPVGKRYSNAAMEEFNREVKDINRNAKGLTLAVLRYKVLFGNIGQHTKEKHCLRSELTDLSAIDCNDA